MTDLELVLRSLAEIRRLISQELQTFTRSLQLGVPHRRPPRRAAMRQTQSVSLLGLPWSPCRCVVKSLSKGQRSSLSSIIRTSGPLLAAVCLNVLQVLGEAIALVLKLA